VFVKANDKNVHLSKIIDKVRFGLHETFGAEYIDARADATGKFEKSFTGWGTFDVPTTIFFKRETGLPIAERKLELNHHLSFEGNGKWR